MDIIGKATIHPVLFYSGKIAGYITWILFIAQHTGIYHLTMEGVRFGSQVYLSYFFLGLALVFIPLSLINLGKSTRLGLPETGTTLKRNGLYKLSRNPMYLGFDFLTIAAMIYTLHVAVIILGLYSILVYHRIIKGEEKFLEKRFGEEYAKYKSVTRRYL